MAKITEISEQKRNKKRVNIYLDGSFACGIMLETLAVSNLKTGDEITLAELEKLQFDSEKAEAYDKALTFVSKAMKTKKQVREKLTEKGYLPKIVDYCVNKLCEYNFINDDEYCKSYVRTYMHQRGAKMIERDLKLKGIDFNIVERAIESEYDGGEQTAVKIAFKHIKNKEHTKENLAKTYKYLLSKGFSYEESSFAIGKIKEDLWNEF